jgi:hypothetical protein
MEEREGEGENIREKDWREGKRTENLAQTFNGVAS